MAEKIATRQAYGDALVEFGANEKIVVFDADLSKSTKTAGFQAKYPERFFPEKQHHIEDIDGKKEYCFLELDEKPIFKFLSKCKTNIS